MKKEEEEDLLTLRDTRPNCLRLKISAQGSVQLLLRKKTGVLTATWCSWWFRTALTCF